MKKCRATDFSVALRVSERVTAFSRPTASLNIVESALGSFF